MEAILATDILGGISKNGIIPWKSKEDMNFFYNKTVNNVVVMGRKTYYSLPDKYRPLKNRLNIVLTSDRDKYLDEEYRYNNVLFISDINLIYNIKSIITYKYPFINKDPIIYIIGGKNIYEKFIDKCNIVWLSIINKDYECDLFFKYSFENYTTNIILNNNDLIILQKTKL